MIKPEFKLHVFILLIFIPSLMLVGFISLAPGFIESNKIVTKQLESYWRQQEKVSKLTLEFELEELANIVSLVAHDSTLIEALLKGDQKRLQEILFTAFDANVSGNAGQLLLHDGSLKEYLHAGYELKDLTAVYEKITELLPFRDYKIISVQQDNIKPMVLAIYSSPITYGELNKVVGYVTGIYHFNDRISLNSLFKNNTGVKDVEILFGGQIISRSNPLGSQVSTVEMESASSVTFSLFPFDIKSNLQLRLISESSPLIEFRHSITQSLMVSAVLLILFALVVGYVCSYQAKKFMGRLIYYVRDVTSKNPRLQFKNSIIHEVNEVVLSLGKVVIDFVREKEKSEYNEKQVVNLNVDLERLIAQLHVEMDERQKAQVEQYESEKKFRSLVSNMPGVSYRCKADEGWTVEFISEEINKLSGFPVTDFIGNRERSFASIVHPDDLQKVDKAVHSNRTINVPYDIEYRIIRADGQVRWVLERGQGIFDESVGLQYQDGVILDITERKNSDQELHQLRLYLSNIFDSMPSILIGVDLESRVTQWNMAAENATGIMREEAAGQTLGEVFPRLSNQIESIQSAIHTRENNLLAKQAYQEGGATRYEDVVIYPLVTNGVKGAVIRLDDISEKVHMEDMMVQSEKMLSVGGLAAGMAHEINNPLASMTQTASVLRSRLTEKDMPANQKAAQATGVNMEALYSYMETRGILRMINAINDSGHRIEEIVENMLSFARKSDAVFSSRELGELMDKTLELAATDYDLKKQYDFKTIKIVKDYGLDLPCVPCDSSSVQQVFLNILRNGAQAMQDAKIKDGQFTLQTWLDTDKNMVCIGIADNGPGMDKETQKRTFEPFFTTKSVGEGTGLGLSVSYFIISENHGGELMVESAPGEGCRFIIALPVKGKEVAL